MVAKVYVLNSKPTLFKITKLNWVDVMRFQRERQMCLLATVVINTVVVV